MLEEGDVEGSAVVGGVPGGEQGGDAGALVVGRAAAEVAVAVLPELERLLLPLRLLRRLPVPVVVNGQGGVRRVSGLEFPDDDRVAGGPHALGRRRAALAQQL